jgi:hypothetical protein
LQLPKPIYESLPWAYALASAVLIAISHELHSGAVSLVLLLAGVLGLVGAAAVWLRRRDFRATRAEYWSQQGQPGIDVDVDDEASH